MKTDDYINVDDGADCTDDETFIQSAQFLIDCGVDVDLYDGMALINACGRDGNLEFVKLLLDNDADVNICNGKPLYTASIANNMEAVELLLKHGADVSLDNYKAIKWACTYGYNDIVQLLLYNATGYWADDDSDYDKIKKASKNYNLVEFINNLKEQMVA
jgi:ankyrin repeat protein